MTRFQFDKIAELTAKGWLSIPSNNPEGSAVFVADPEGKVWMILSDGKLVAYPKEGETCSK